MYTLHLGNCVSILPTLPENSIDSIVCDPPYELGFMGKSWDASGIAYSVKMWQEALRVLKPGGHLLAFSGSRTYHRMTCAIEDAGFEVRDQILWVYGSGFPKSLDVSKAIDKAAGAEREVLGPSRFAARANKTPREIQPGGGATGEWVDARLDTAPATEAAKQWQGWGTALKPAHEPICVARKPLTKGLTVAANVLAHGTGALNIDGCRVGGPGGVKWETPRGGIWATDSEAKAKLIDNPQGRWPANLIHDGSDEVLALFPETHARGNVTPTKRTSAIFGSCGESEGEVFGGDKGSAARFFYCAKTSKKDRNEGCEEVMTWENADPNGLIQEAHLHLRGISETTTRLLGGYECSTTLCGNNTTAKYPEGLIYTIRTVIRLITESRTWNSSQSSTIKENILDVTRMLTANGSSLAESVELLNRFLPSITDERTVSVLGAVLAVLKTLLPISESAKKGNVHSTVKPTDLMRYLCRLVTPPGGTVLDPFMGSGSTGKAAMLEGFAFVGIEMDETYHTIAKARIDAAAVSLFADIL